MGLWYAECNEFSVVIDFSGYKGWEDGELVTK